MAALPGSGSGGGKEKQATSSYDAFNSVDQLVSKPVVGSDGAQLWQSYQKANKKAFSGTSISAPTAPLKKIDRASGFANWEDERRHERQVRKESGVGEASGYTHFRDKSSAEEASKRKAAKIIESRTRPEGEAYFLPSNTFQGWKFDYVFTTRDRGTGYYWDGMDSVKKLHGELTEEPHPKKPNQAKAEKMTIGSNAEAAGEERIRKKKKRKIQGPVIIDDPNNPLEQVAAAIRRKQSSAMGTSAAPTGWEATIDPATGKTYYYCRLTGERSWDMPSESSLPKAWKVAKDATTGKEYYYNTDTGETKWELPK